MVLFSSPDSVRAVFRLDPAIAPAGQSWEFLRPFAGPHSILLLDGEEHIRERRLLQGPFHGERMRAFAPMIGELARRELTTWNGRVVALDRMRELTLDIILRVVFGARDDELAHVRGVIEESLATVRSLPWVLAMAIVRKDLGPRSPWGRFRIAVERFDAELYELLARRRAEAREDSMLALLLEARDERRQPAQRSAPPRPAGRLARGRPRQLRGLAGVGVRAPGPPPGGAGAPARGRSGLPRRGRQGGAARPAGADDRATPAARAGADRGPRGARRGPGRGLPVARVPAPRSVAARRRVPSRAVDSGSRPPGAEPDVVDSVRRRGAPLRRRAVRGDGDAGGAACGRGPVATAGPSGTGARPSQHAGPHASPRRRGARRGRRRTAAGDSVPAP